MDAIRVNDEKFLYSKFVNFPKLSNDDFKSVCDFLGSISLKGRTEVESDYYAWLCDVGERWQRLLSIAYNESIDVRSELLFTNPAPKILPPDPLSKGVICYLQEQAYFIGQARKLRRISELLENSYRIHELLPSTSQEVNDDWFQSRLLFALQMIEGRILLPLHSELENFTQLQYCFYEDIKKLKAYFLWKAARVKLVVARLCSVESFISFFDHRFVDDSFAFRIERHCSHWTPITGTT